MRNVPSFTELRVLLVSTERRWRGGEVQATLLARGLEARGVEVIVQARPDGGVARRFGDAGLTVIEASGKGLRAARSARRTIRDWRPRIIHANDSGAVLPAGIAALGRRSTVHVAARRVAFPLRRPRLLAALVDHVVCVAPAVAAEVAPAVGAARATVIPDGIALERLDRGDREAGRRAFGVDRNTRVVLCVAALDRAKGQERLIREFGHVAETHADLQLVLVGEGDDLAALQRLAAESGVASRTRFLGFRYDVPDLLTAADLFVSASDSEGLGSATLEAMAAGCPVVATPVGGARDLLATHEGEVGWTVGPAPGDLATALRAALDDPNEAATRAGRARARARAYSSERMVDGTLALYRRLLDARAGDQRR